ncbi:MAG: hypothetical protein ABL899_00060 [Nitrospira sp.]
MKKKKVVKTKTVKKKVAKKSAVQKKVPSIPLSVIGVEGGVCMLSRVDKKTTSSLVLLASGDGLDFTPVPSSVSLVDLKGRKENLKNCSNFSISRTPNGYVLTYYKYLNAKSGAVLVVARSKDLLEWRVMSEIKADDSTHSTVLYDRVKDKFELYRDGLFIKHQSSTSLSLWKEKPTLLFTSRNGQFDMEKISIVGGTVTNEGMVLIYDASVQHESKSLLQVGAVIVDVKNPKHILWRSGMPIWQGVVEAKEKSMPIKSIGFVTLGKSFLIYWMTADFNLVVAKIPILFREVEDARFHPKILERSEHNPILEPLKHNHWENEGAFNPSVVEDDEGTIHLVYRAIGGDGVSRVGYAKSKNGTHFTDRSPYPIYEPARGYGMPEAGKTMGPEAYNPYIYVSGGGWGGAEDPRIVLIENTVYMMYTAFEGWWSMRIAITSISLDDFKAGRWLWKRPRLISSPENRSKNWLLFPEKINGKYAILHSISPKVLVDYVDDIDTFDDIIYSPRPEGPQPGRKNSWDFLLKGSGPPPVKTEMGWLLLYHALEKSDTGKYRLGAMVLDKNDPTKVLHRSAHPILSPDMHYENDGKPGVVYASGAIIRGDDLYVYYGGGDKVVCVAKTPIKQLLKYLKTGDLKEYQLKEV